MDLKEHFAEYDDICNRINELEMKLYELKMNLYSVSGISYDRIPSEPQCNDKMLAQIIEIDEVIQEINDLKAQKQKLYIKHLEEIAKVNDQKYRTLLRGWYLLKLDVYNVAKTLNVSRQHLYRMKKEAENEFLRQNATKCDSIRQVKEV